MALQAKQRYPGLAKLMGQAIKAEGNHALYFMMSVNGVHSNLLTFPTKHVWWKPSDLELIKRSAMELQWWAVKMPDHAFYLPRPGCSNGGLKWAQVEPVLREVGLPDNIVVVTNDKREWRENHAAD
jgi:hypothetical protein